MLKAALWAYYLSLAVLPLIACNGDTLSAITISDRKFLIPKNRLSMLSVPWLSKDGVDGFNFVLNPDDPITRQAVVSVQSSKRLCNARPAHPEQLAQVCSRIVNGVVDKNNQSNTELVKQVRTQDGAQFYYTFRSNNVSYVIADCYQVMSSRKNAECTSIGSHYDLIYLIDFGASEVATLPEMHRRVRSLLTQWEYDHRRRGLR